MLMTMKLDQRLAMSQQLRQAITLLQYNTVELRQLVQQYIETNPLIDIEEIELASNYENLDENNFQSASPVNISNQSMQYGDTSFENYPQIKSLREYLIDQTLLCKFNNVEQTIAEAIIDTIDDDGFLTMSLEEIYQSILEISPVTMEQIESILKKIQTFDPAGIASHDIRECLLNQLHACYLKNNIWDLAHEIINKLLENFSFNSIKQIIKQMKGSNQDYAGAISLIKSFNFHPGGQYISNNNLHHKPELYVENISGNWQIYLVDSVLTHVKINKQYQELMKKDKKHAAYASLKQELEEAKWLVNGLKKRNQTLLQVANHIIKMQQEFLIHGHESLQPMNIIDVSDALGLHESTVSRITTGKYISTPYGVFELKYFFPSQVATQSGDGCSSVTVKSFIKDIISKETAKHIYSDSDIVNLLKEKGITIARRTVAKYRESMNLLSSYQRQMQYSAISTDDQILGDLNPEVV